MTKIFFTLLILGSLFSGCVPSPYYQNTFSIPSNKWDIDYKPNFDIDIEDTLHYYNVSFLVRHTNAYPFANIWMNVLVQYPGDTVFKKTRIEIPLATPQGKWLGAGMGEIYEQRRMLVLNHDEQPITDELISISEESLKNLFHKKGRYKILLEQNMREKSLPHVLQIGLRIEKSSVRKLKAESPNP